MKHEHHWKRVQAVVTAAGASLAFAGSKPMGRAGTYNAECACGARAWLHWPEPRFNEHSEDVP